MNSILQDIKNMARGMSEELRDTRRHLHAHPELSWREAETSKYIERKLTGLGLSNVKRGFGGTESGVTGDLVCSDGPCVAIRADIDALPIAEENESEYRSENDGVMHACGHDGHMSALLGAARILVTMKSRVRGSVRFIFQPAEETGDPSGARAVIGDGALEGVDAIGGMHVWSFVKSGTVQWRNGPVMASSDKFSATFTGRGGHGAMPHSAVDPIVAAADFIGALQTIISRELDPVDPAVVTVGKISAGEAFNIIPDKAEILGTLRSFKPETRRGMEPRLSRIADGIASAHRCRAETSVKYLLPSVVNDRRITDIFRRAAAEVAGDENVEESPPLMVSEDFSFYQERVPGTFFFLGAGNPACGAEYPHHSPRFNIDENALATGAALLAAFAARAACEL
ncbi:MAG: amidohydrolase [Synergistaceae bacterium]|jgi:amidohydrolase|nr:amidohydrolase [Synergistaceae bacterium]